jgi:protein-disulfide isomerase
MGAWMVLACGRPPATRPPRDDDPAYQQLLDRLQSPCGKVESLRKALDDPGCPRASFAAAYVERRLDLFTADELAGYYERRYLTAQPLVFDLAEAPSVGPEGAPVVLVEFIDYGCWFCKSYAPIFDEVMKETAPRTRLYWKHLPTGAHPNSVPAALAAIAAQRQGKFIEMSRALFDHQDRHTRDALFATARSLGLDEARFKADFDDPKTRARIDADREEGLDAGVTKTPGVFVNGRMWPEGDSMTKEEILAWIDEELAVNTTRGSSPAPAAPR